MRERQREAPEGAERLLSVAEGRGGGPSQPGGGGGALGGAGEPGVGLDGDDDGGGAALIAHQLADAVEAAVGEPLPAVRRQLLLVEVADGAHAVRRAVAPDVGVAALIVALHGARVGGNAGWQRLRDGGPAGTELGGAALPTGTAHLQDRWRARPAIRSAAQPGRPPRGIPPP